MEVSVTSDGGSFAVGLMLAIEGNVLGRNVGVVSFEGEGRMMVRKVIR